MDNVEHSKTIQTEEHSTLKQKYSSSKPTNKNSRPDDSNPNNKRRKPTKENISIENKEEIITIKGNGKFISRSTKKNLSTTNQKIKKIFQ